MRHEDIKRLKTGDVVFEVKHKIEADAHLVQFDLVHTIGEPDKYCFHLNRGELDDLIAMLNMMRASVLVEENHDETY